MKKKKYNFSNLIYNKMSVLKNIEYERSSFDKTLDADMQKDIANLLIVNSILEGTNKTLQPYTIKVDKLTKLNNDQYKLNSINGKYTTSYGDLLLKANQGAINDNTILELIDNVRIELNHVRLSTIGLEFNLNTQEMISNNLVSANYKHSTITANHFKAEGNGNILHFQGNVKATINLSDF
jgi:hypothetical protein